MSMTAINGVEEVNIFKEDGAVIHIVQPKSTFFYSLPITAFIYLSS